MASTDLIALASYLQHTLSPDMNVRQPAEKLLESLEVNENYSLLLLQLVDKQDLDMNIRLSASIAFKGYVKRNWPIYEDATNKISENDRAAIKNLIVGLMLKSPEQIQRQLSEAVSMIGREDFPSKWPKLLDEMINYMKTCGTNFSIINGILQTAHSLFKRYRHEFKSDLLWTEINLVLKQFAQPFTDLFVWTVELANTHSDNPQALKLIYSSLVLCAKIFNSLNSQDLPEFFEDNMKIWMTHFLNLLAANNKLLQTNEAEEVGLLEQLKSQICDNIAMYAQKYNEEFEMYVQGFVQSVWTLLINTGHEPKYDPLVSNAMNFLSTVAERTQYKELFQAEGVLDSISSKVIIPNMEFRESDEELFEDNPEEYIRRDIEGSDIDTRRRAACELVKALSRNFEEQIIGVFSQYIQSMLTRYTLDPKSNWKSKDAAIYLVNSMAVKGSTTRHGTTSTSQLVNVVDFYTNCIRLDLERPNLTEMPVLKADAIKYLVTFRNQLPLNEVIIPSLPHIVHHLSSPSIVIHTYAAHALEKLFTLRDPDNTSLTSIKVVHVEAFVGPILSGLFNIFNIQGSTENEYAMKALMRAFSLLQEQITPFFHVILPKLTTILAQVAKNPSKPHFNHYLFETLSLSIKIACQQSNKSVSTFESILFPVFQDILVQDVQEFMPYVFQILSIMIEVYESDIPDPYLQVFPCLVSPVLWERPANIAPLVRLLQAFLEKSPRQIVATGKLEALLGVFQKLLASKTNDHHGFYLLQSVVQYVDQASLDQYLKQIFVLLFQRLTTSKTTKYVRSILVFFSFFVNIYGAFTLIKLIDSIQQHMFGMVIDKLFIGEVQKVSGSVERKICAVGITKMLCEADAMMVGEYSKYWAPLLQALICLFELPEDDSIPDDEHFIEIEDTPGYQASYSQLVFAGKKEIDPLKATVPNAKLYLAESLAKLSVKYPGKLNPLIATYLVQDAQTHLKNYCQTANVNLN